MPLGFTTYIYDQSTKRMLSAAYVYDSFGRMTLQTCSLTSTFRYRYSTKSYECETKLYYYGKRFYSPIIRCWLNRDPIEDERSLGVVCLSV